MSRSPMGCSSSSPRKSSTSSIRSRSSASGASGPATARKLHAVRLLTVGDVAGISEETLTALLGRASGRHLYALSRNHDARRVRPGRRRGSIGAQRALGRSSTSPEALDATLVRSSTASPAGCGRPGGSGAPSSSGFASATSRGRRAVAHAAAPDGPDARDPCDGARAPRGGATGDRAQGLTLVGISVANLERDDAVQLVLPFADDGQDAVDSAIDAVRIRFGTAAITRGVLLGRDGGFEMPHLPD